MSKNIKHLSDMEEYQYNGRSKTETLVVPRQASMLAERKKKVDHSQIKDIKIQVPYIKRRMSKAESKLSIGFVNKTDDQLKNYNEQSIQDAE